MLNNGSLIFSYQVKSARIIQFYPRIFLNHMTTTESTRLAIPNAILCQSLLKCKKGQGKAVSIIRHPVMNNIQTVMVAKALKTGGILDIL
jgi:hypothetical protein